MFNPGVCIALVRRAIFLAALTWLCMPVRADTVLRVGVYDNPPKVLWNAQASGSLIDLLKEIARVRNWELRFERCDWQRCLEMLERGDLDLMPDVARTEEREHRFDFHQIPALHSWSQLYRRSGIRVESVLDLQGKRVAVLSNGVQQEALTNMLRGFNVRFELVEVKTVVEAFEMVSAGRADVALPVTILVITRLTAMGWWRRPSCSSRYNFFLLHRKGSVNSN